MQRVCFDGRVLDKCSIVIDTFLVSVSTIQVNSALISYPDKGYPRIFSKKKKFIA